MILKVNICPMYMYVCKHLWKLKDNLASRDILQLQSIYYLSLLLLFAFLRFLCVALESVLEVTLVEQAGLELIEICLPLPPECWD